MAAETKNVYIFLGPELGKKQDAFDVLKNKFQSPEFFSFYAGESPVSMIADTLLNISLFSDSRIVTVKNADLIKKKDEIELLASCMLNIDKNTVLVLLSDENKLAPGLEDAIVKAGVPKNNRQVFYEMFEKEKQEWLISFFKREGYSIDRDCVNAILELVENNTDALKRECSRLLNFLPAASAEENGAFKSARSVTAGDIEKWLSHNREESAFTLFSRIAQGDMSKALESLSVMLAAKESAIGILSTLAGCFRKLGDYLTLLEEGNANNNFEMKKIGITSPKAKDDYAAASRNYNAQSVQACLALTAEYNVLLRSPVSVMENILMDRYIIALVNNAN